jgi:uncharacterized protein (TIGR03066 family)
MAAVRLMAAGLAIVGLIAGARAEEKKADNKAKLLGAWEVVKSDEGGPPVGTVVEFAKDGKMKLTHKVDGKEETLPGTYTIDGEKLNVTIKREDKDNKHTVTIKKLTDTEMVAENEKGAKAEFKRKGK